MKRKAFTLVELLVVLAIIAVLISILLPSLSKVREQAKRIACAANLRTLGQASMNFANEHKGYFPTAWGYGQDNFANVGVAFPPILSLNTIYSSDLTSGPNRRGWQRFGTPYAEMLRYAPGKSPFNVVDGNGASPTINLASWLVCPSSRADRLIYWTPQNDGWGTAIETGYLYVAGIPSRKIGSFSEYAGGVALASGTNYGNRIPAVRQSEPGSSKRVIAADRVWWAGTANPLAYVINHVDRRDARKASFQNVLFADGHVSGEKPTFRNALTGVVSDVLDTNNWSLVHTTPANQCFYWGQE